MQYVLYWYLIALVLSMYDTTHPDFKFKTWWVVELTLRPLKLIQGEKIMRRCYLRLLLARFREAKMKVKHYVTG